jgi:hypothetical protein
VAGTGYTNFPLVGNSPKLKIIAGMFQVNGNNAPDVLVGHGFTVAAPSAAGKFTVTLDKTYHRCVSVQVTVGETTSTQLFKAEVEEIDRTTTFSSFIVHTTSTVTDTTTDDQQVNFLVVVTDSSIVNERSS